VQASTVHRLPLPSTNWPWRTAGGFYACYAALIGLAAALVLTPHVPLGLLTEGVQVLAGVLLPSASVFLLLLCNDKAVLGPWVNGKKLNAFTGTIVGILVLLSVVLTVSVLFPNITGSQIEGILLAGIGVGLGVALFLVIQGRRSRNRVTVDDVLADTTRRDTWRMPNLSRLERPVMSRQRKVGLITLRGYLLIAFVLVIVKIVEVAVG
jgi:hypothetical protein